MRERSRHGEEKQAPSACHDVLILLPEGCPAQSRRGILVVGANLSFPTPALHRQSRPLADVVTQPYDKISPAMRSRYLALSPYNLVRVILGERTPADSDSDNVYTRAAAHLDYWMASGVLARDAEPGIFPYFQEFTVPDTGERLVRKGFIALGAVEEYAAGVVHRHEQTLSGPKKDRLELLRHTHAHFGQLFMLYPDRAGAIDALLDEAAAARAAGRGRRRVRRRAPRLEDRRGGHDSAS